MWKYRGNLLQLLVTPAVSHCQPLLPEWVFWGRHSKGTLTRWLKPTTVCFLTTLEAWSLTPLTFWVDPPLLLPASGGGCERQHLWSCYQHSSDLSVETWLSPSMSLSVPSCLSRASVIMACPAPKWPHLTLIICANTFYISNAVLIPGISGGGHLVAGEKTSQRPPSFSSENSFFCCGLAWLLLVSL